MEGGRVLYPWERGFLCIKSVRLAHTRAGARLRQQPFSFARSAPPAGGFCVIGNAVSYYNIFMVNPPYSQ